MTSPPASPPSTGSGARHSTTPSRSDLTHALARWRPVAPAAGVHARSMARSLGGVYLAAAILILVWTVLPVPRQSDVLAIVVVAAIALAVGTVLLSGRLDHGRRITFEVAVALATVLISLADYYARVRGTGLTYLYLWCTPFAYWFFPRRRARLQAVLVVIGFAAAAIAASAAHPAQAGTVADDWGSIMLLAGTVITVGELVCRLGLTIDESHQRFARVFAQAPTPMARISLDGRYTDANAAFCQAAGRSRSEVIGATVAELSPPDQLRSLFEARERMLAGHVRGYQFDAQIMRPDGRRVTLATNVSLLDAPDSPGPEMFVQALDLTRREEAEQALAASERRYRSLVETSQAVVWSCDVDGVCTFVNEAIRDVLGYEPEEAVGRPIAGALPAQESDQLPEIAAAAAATGRDWRELTYRRKDGRLILCSLQVAALRDAHGRVTGFTGTLLDVTERRRAEEALRVSEARLRAIIDNAPAAITIRGADGRLTEVNQEAARVMGRLPEELIGRTVRDVFSHHEAQEITLHDRHVLRHGEPVFSEQTLTLPDGEHIFLAVGFPLPARPGEQPSVCRISFDVTDREQARQQLDRLNEQRRRLLAELVRAQEDERRRIAADVHDDSIQVLAGVAIRLGMLAGMLDRPEQQRLIAGLDDSVRRGIRSLRQLLFDLRLPALDELGLAAALRSYLSETIAREGATYDLEDHLEQEPAPELRTVLYRVAQEALSNVRKHAHARHVTVRLSSDDDGFAVTVRDNGVGFDAAAHPDEAPGHLGMVGMRERVEAAGGWIEVHSAPGQGTSVRFGVPGQPQPASPLAGARVR